MPRHDLFQLLITAHSQRPQPSVGSCHASRHSCQHDLSLRLDISDIAMMADFVSILKTVLEMIE